MRPDDFPLDGAPLCHTASFNLRETGKLSSSFTVHDADNDQTPVYIVSRASIVGRSYSATAAPDHASTVASMRCPTWSFGHWSIEFAGPRPGHPVEVRPVGMGSKDDMFVVDSVPFFWEVEGSCRKLTMARDGRRMEVGTFEAESIRDTKGLLRVNAEVVDVLVAVMTAITQLKRLDSFRK